MSLGFGKVARSDWDKVRTGSSMDVVDPGDYFGVITDLREMDPSKSQKGIGAFIVVFKTTEDNAAAWQGKQLEGFFNYHPNPSAAGERADGYAKMNEMTLTKMAQLIEAANVVPDVDEGGNFDLVATLRKLPAASPKVLITVGRDDRGQTLVGYRPIAG